MNNYAPILIWYHGSLISVPIILVWRWLLHGGILA